MALLSRVHMRVPTALGASALPTRPVRMVLTRAEPPSGGARVTREYRDGDAEVTVNAPAGATQTSDGLYAGTSAPSVPRPKPNLSKEMKSRLRQEYMGLGGAENTVAAAAAAMVDGAGDTAAAWAPSPRVPYIVAAASVEVLAEAGTASGAGFEARPEGSTAEDTEASTSASRAGASKWVIDDKENLRSTPEQRAWTWASIAMIAATMNQAAGQVSNTEDVVTLGAAVLLAYILADFGTGVYHWGVDNYGDGSTPFFGRQIAAFQGHHQRPWTITQREFANNLHQVFQPASYPAALLLVASPLMPLGWNAWSSSFLFLVCMSQQFHAWSHMKKSELHPAVVALQDSGVLIGRRMHGAHHRSPFEGNYCIVSGLWNPLLDSSAFFRKMEKAIHTSTGVEPRCWHEPEYEWRELERPAEGAAPAV